MSTHLSIFSFFSIVLPKPSKIFSELEISKYIIDHVTMSVVSYSTQRKENKMDLQSSDCFSGDNSVCLPVCPRRLFLSLQEKVMKNSFGQKQIKWKHTILVK